MENSMEVPQKIKNRGAWVFGLKKKSIISKRRIVKTKQNNNNKNLRT